MDADVAIVGCGPVGNTLAILLAQLGRRVVVLERWPEPYPLPRAVHMDHEVARIFQSCGLGAALRDIGEPAEIYEWRNATGTTLLRFGRVGNSASGWPESLMFNQPALEARLDARAAALGIDVRRGVEVVGLTQDVAGVTLHCAAGTEVAARYVVGCDGANSTVRALLDAPVHDLGFFFDWLIVDVVLAEPRVFDPINVQICDPGRPTTAVSGGPGRRRWEFMRLPHETLEELNDEQRAWELLAAWNVHPGNARLERHAVYTFSARFAEQWRADRVLLAGDAAHLMPPFAGQGMCSGIRDAANLAWKLDLVLDGRADAELLDTYQAERLPDARQAIDFSMALGKVICVADEAEAAARDAAMAAGVGDEPAPAPPIEGLFVQGRVDGVPFDDAHGAGWRLVTLHAPALDDDARAWFASLGGKVVVLDTPDENYARWFREHDATCALQRPDFHVFGGGNDAAALVADLRRHLSPSFQGVPQ